MKWFRGWNTVACGSISSEVHWWGKVGPRVSDTAAEVSSFAWYTLHAYGKYIGVVL
jgi:hypothetical protein